MNTEQTEKWLSAHIYYNEPWEHLLHNSLLPFVNSAVKMGIISQYFFVRYWDRGPHLRLRLKGDAETLTTILQPHVEEHFQNFMDTYPSTRIDPSYPIDFPATYKWYPNNSIVFSSYIPETERYAGGIGMLLSEEQFYLSSQLVLQLIKTHKDDWTYDDAMGRAIQLHLTFAHAMGLSLEEAIDFFHFFYKNWLNQKEETNQQSHSRFKNSGSEEETIATFERAYNFQKEILESHIAQLWHSLENDYADVPEDTKEWHRQNKAIQLKIQQANANQQLNKRTAKYRYAIAAPNPLAQTLWSLYADFVHLLNNRLGIHNRDESFIAYILVQSLSAMPSGKSPYGVGLRSV